MLALEFPGWQALIRTLDGAVQLGSTTAITDALRDGLCQLIRDPQVCLPACVFEPCPEHYARRELYTSEKYGYNVVAMTWGPGQGTPIHDHAGMWCVEGVWRGQLEITQYELCERKDDRFHFESQGTMQAGPGSAGSLIPPHEYHTIRNPSKDVLAVSLHIYRGPMTSCSVFRPIGNNWFERDSCNLRLDETH